MLRANKIWAIVYMHTDLVTIHCGLIPKIVNTDNNWLLSNAVISV